MELTGTVALVTGGAAGLGAHLTRALSARGAHVVIADRDQAASDRLAAELSGPATVVPTDVGDDDALIRLIDRASALGPLRVAVNNAGGWMSAACYPTADPADWEATLRVNLWAPMRITQLAAPALVAAGGGAVVHVGSSAARGNEPYDCPEYAVAKAGLVRFTTATGRLGPTGEVRVTAVVPGWIGLPRAVEEYAALTSAAQGVSGGLIDPGRLAEIVADLATDDSAAGVVLAVDADRPPYPLAGLP